MRFTKMHGAGNDFVVLDLRDGLPPRMPRWPHRSPIVTAAWAATRS